MRDLKHPRRRKLVWVVALATCFLVARYVAAIAWSESGSRVAGEAWANAVDAAAAREFIPVHRRFPQEQAAFWMARTESLPDDPDLLCGAALILDKPSAAYRSRLLKRRTGSVAEDFRDILPPVEFDDEAIDRAEEAFQARTTERCLNLLRRATDLASHDQDLWRTRALLLFRGVMMPQYWESRTADWASILDEAQRHDPDNALYDLIAAMHMLRASADLDVMHEVPKVTVRNRLMMEDAVRRLERGLSRPKLQLGASRSRFVWRFLSVARFAGIHPSQIGALDDFEFRIVFLLRELVRWQRGLAELSVIEERPGDAVKGLDLLLNMPRLMKCREGNDYTFATLAPLFEQVIVANVTEVSRELSEVQATWDAEQLAAEYEGAKQEIGGMDARRTRLRFPPTEIQEVWPLIASLLAAFAPILVLPCVTIGGGLLWLNRVLHRTNEVPSTSPLRIRWWIPLWLGGFLLSAGLAWFATFWQGNRSASTHATPLDNVILEMWGRSALALIVFLRGPFGWKILATTLGLLLVATVWRHVRLTGCGWSHARDRGLAFARDGARLSLGMAALLLLLHLACLPSQIGAVDALEQQWRAWAADPWARWAAWDASAEVMQ